MAARFPRNAPRRFSRIFQLLHWSMATFVLTMLALGFLIEKFPKGSPERTGIFAWHMSIGFTILMLVVFRMAWRATHAIPAEPVTLPPPLRATARLTHYLLYALMLGMPLVGWMMVSSRPKPEGTLDLALGLHWPQIPGFAERFGHWRPVLGDLHAYGAWAFIALISLHAGAALFHHIVLRDETLLRMVPMRLHPLLHRLRGSIR